MVKTRMHIKIQVLLLSIVIILCASGCDGKASDSPSLQKATEEASSGGVSDFVNSEGVKYLSESAWKNVPVTTLDFARKVPLAISEDGMLVWVEWTEEDEKLEKENDTLVVCNIKTGAKETIASVNYPAQIYFALINENWIVWIQTLYGDGFGDGSCAVYSYNRSTKEINLCYKADSKVEADSVSSRRAPNPALKGNKLLLDVLSGISENGRTINICYEYDLESGERKEIAKQILHPEFEDGYIIGMGQDMSNTDKDYSILYKIDNKELTPLMDKGMYIYDFATDGHGAVLYTAQIFETSNIAEEEQKRDLYLMKNGESTLLDAKTSEEVSGSSWPSLSERIAMWRFDNCPYAYDRLLKKVIRLSDDEQRTSAFLTNDSYIIWTYRSEKRIKENAHGTDALNIISISDLPIN